MPVKPKDQKRCTLCGEHKPRTEFYPHSVAKNGVSAWCRVCTNQSSREAQKKRAPQSTALIQRRAKIKKAYGITLDQYDQMLDEQGGCCAICGTDTPSGSGRFHVDHCHKTKKIRGLLCHHCNIGLGVMRDSTEILQKAIRYLIGE